MYNQMTNGDNIMSKRFNAIVTLLLAVVLAFGSLALVGCGGGGDAEQDNCYGDDMPVINE